MTMISWVIILSLAAIQIVAAMRIAPVYLNYSTVKKVMEEVKDDPKARGAMPAQLGVLINKRLNINGIRDLQNNKSAFTYSKTKEGMNISLHYEERGPIYGNLEFVATFDYAIDVPNQ